MAQETQDFIDEIQTPTHLSNVARQSALQSLAAYLRSDGMQIADLRSLLQQAELTEADDILRGKFELMFQKLGALQRQQRKLADEARLVHASIADLIRIWTDEVRDAAATAGYTV